MSGIMTASEMNEEINNNLVLLDTKERRYEVNCKNDDDCLENVQTDKRDN